MLYRYFVIAPGLIMLLAGCARPNGSQKLTIAAAADLNFALEPISGAFRAAHPEVTLEINYGSSGNYYTQLRNRAPFDLFLSADLDYPRKLLTEGIGLPDSLFVYALGRIVIWVPAGSTRDPATVLRDPALRSLGVYDRVEKKLVLGENIAQTLQFVETGAADAGIVALSLALAPQMRGKGRYWELPLDAYPKMEQGGIILKPSPAAADFRGFLLSAPARRILREYGFGLPGE